MELDTIACADCFELIEEVCQTVGPNSVDLIATDMPVYRTNSNRYFY